MKSNVLRRTDVPETREAGYQRQPNIRASERDEENEELGRLSAVWQSFDLATCLGEHELLNKSKNRTTPSSYRSADRSTSYSRLCSQLCIRGRTHIFKYLERQAAKHERARGGRTRRTPLDVRGHATLDMRTHRRHNVDSGYSTSDGVDKRWSQEIHSAVSFFVLLLALVLFLRFFFLDWLCNNLFGYETS